MNSSVHRWKPNVTVATVVTRLNQYNEVEYLFVHEIRDGKEVYNQPAGHLDEGDGLIAAAERETLEETAWEVKVTDFIGIYRFIGTNGTTYMRHVFSAEPIKFHDKMTLDDGIIEAVWMTQSQIAPHYAKLRSTIVEEAINDYRQGQRYPLSLIHEPHKNG